MPQSSVPRETGLTEAVAIWMKEDLTVTISSKRRNNDRVILFVHFVTEKDTKLQRASCVFTIPTTQTILDHRRYNQLNPPPTVSTSNDTIQAAIDSADVEAMDSLPFDDDCPEIDLEQAEFHECGTWSEDEDGNIVTGKL